jgi:Zn-dependent protease with chaperone function
MGGLAGLFRTHPETAKRVAALKAMAVQPQNTPALQSA